MALPIPPLFGPEIDRGSATPNLVPQNWLTNAAVPPILIRQWARNGRYPDAYLASAMGEAMNQAAMLRPKQVFLGLNTTSTTSPIAASGSAQARWRWAWHTGPLTHQVAVVAVMHPTSSTTAGDSYTTVQIDKAAGGGTQSDTFHVGANPANSAAVTSWQYRRVFTTYLPVDPDTDYVGLFSDGIGALLQSACVYEVASMTQNNNGYFPQNVPERAPILSTDRSRMMALIRTLWRRGGSHVLNWYCKRSGTDPRSITSSTATNIVDGTSTAISSATPGYTLDMRYKDRLTETSGVPCKMYAYAQLTGSATTGTVYLKDSGGATVTSVTGFTTTAGWQSVQFNLPATLAKYDLMAAMTGGGGAKGINVHAVSIFEHTA